MQQDYINNQLHRRDQRVIVSLRNPREEKETRLAVAVTTKKRGRKTCRKDYSAKQKNPQRNRESSKNRSS